MTLSTKKASQRLDVHLAQSEAQLAGWDERLQAWSTVSVSDAVRCGRDHPNAGPAGCLLPPVTRQVAARSWGTSGQDARAIPAILNAAIGGAPHFVMNGGGLRERGLLSRA
jgi:hypothetical protein